MATRIFKQTGRKTEQIYHSILIFFQFFGQLIYNLLFNWNAILWQNTVISTLRAGAWIFIPLSILSMLMGMSLTLSIHYILSRFNLQNQAMFIAQNTIITDFSPLPIGFVLCVQCGLNLINSDHPSLHHTPEKVILETIIPLIAGINCTAILLYAYVSFSFFLSIFFTFYYFLQTNTDEYLLRLGSIIRPIDIIISIGKTMIFATIASLTAGYYYYDVAKRVIPTRKAVSRIITRGLFWLIVISVLIKIFFSI